jgi:predicted ferric reductase
LSVKWHGTFHLIYSFGFVSIITCVVFAVPIIFIKQYYPQYHTFFKASTILYICFFIYVLHYFIAFKKNAPGNFTQNLLVFLIRFPLFVSLFIGISLNNAVGIIQGYCGVKTAFVRTPKFNWNSDKKKGLSNRYAYSSINSATIAEGLLVIYFLFGLVAALHFKNFATVPLFLLAIIGFAMVFILTFQERSNNSIDTDI